jgi:hypothetical protein
LEPIWHALIIGLQFIDKYSGAVAAIATAFIATFTIVLALVTGRQARLTRETLTLARDEFLSSHRPLLKIKLVECVIVEGERAGVTFTVVNAGQSDAFVIGSCAKADFFGPVDWPHPNDYGIDNVIPPQRFVAGATGRYTIKTVNPIGYMEIIPGNTDTGGKTLRFYGYIVYQNAAKNVRTTFFCRAYNPRLDRFDPVDRPDYDTSD